MPIQNTRFLPRHKQLLIAVSQELDQLSASYIKKYQTWFQWLTSAKILEEVLVFLSTQNIRDIGTNDFIDSIDTTKILILDLQPLFKKFNLPISEITLFREELTIIFNEDNNIEHLISRIKQITTELSDDSELKYDSSQLHLVNAVSTTSFSIDNLSSQSSQSSPLGIQCSSMVLQPVRHTINDWGGVADKSATTTWGEPDFSTGCSHSSTQEPGFF